jgi:DNA-binding NarL/FixJ family response regulator
MKLKESYFQNFTQMNDKRAHVLIVDDHPLFRERLCQLINNEPDMEVSGQAETAESAVQLILAARPDLAIVDITLKGSSGLELTKTLRALSINLPILILSMHDESLYAERALRGGAMGYITKNQGADEVLSAVRRILAGEIYVSEKMTSVFLKNVTGSGMRTPARPIDRLTDREFEVLELIGRGQTTRAIAEALHVGVATVDTYRARIKEKMNFRNGTELQHFAIRWLRDRE